jgi:hypothetical protein
MKGEFEVQFHVFFTWTLDGVKWLYSRPGRFIFGEIFPGNHLDRRVSGSQNLSGSCREEINLLCLPEVKLRRFWIAAPKLASILTEISRLMMSKRILKIICPTQKKKKKKKKEMMKRMIVDIWDVDVEISITN